MTAPSPETLVSRETNFAAWLRIYRIKLRVAAERMGVTLQQIARYRKDRNDPDWCWMGPGPAEALREWSRGGLHAGNYADIYDPDFPLPPPVEPNTGAQRADGVPADTQ